MIIRNLTIFRGLKNLWGGGEVIIPDPMDTPLLRISKFLELKNFLEMQSTLLDFQKNGNLRGMEN